MCGALLRYITSPTKDFQPMGANMGLLPPLEQRVRDKRRRYALLAQRALLALGAPVPAELEEETATGK
jgi:methylenetetrahydrofolate--tRNA-(uracil-5-)-methyltransferase